MEPKTKRQKLLLTEKIDILDKLNDGATEKEIGEKYNISRSTIKVIRKKEAEYRACVNSLNASVLKTKKNMKPAKYKTLDDALYLWFVQKRHCGDLITGSVLRQKALDFNEKMNGLPSFKASEGWLQTFKKRHNIGQLSSLKGERLTFNTNPAENFIPEFYKFIQENEYKPENIYNADETSLKWRALPCKIWSDRRKCSEDRMTVVTCANAIGTDRIPLLLIGKYEEPKCFESNGPLPLMYKIQKESWMTQEIFLDWYINIFVPYIQKKQERTNAKEKVLLLIDDVPAHPSEEVLNTIDDNITVYYLPPNVMSLQPMTHGITAEMKMLYRKGVLKEFLISKNIESVDTFLEKFTVKECCDILSNEWCNVSNAILQNAWKPLFNTESNVHDNVFHSDSELLEEIAKINPMPSYIRTNEDVAYWFNYKERDSGWKPLEDEEILVIIQQKEQLENRNYISTDIIECMENGKRYGKEEKQINKVTARKRIMRGLQEDPLKDIDMVAPIQQREQSSITNPFTTVYFINCSRNNDGVEDSKIINFSETIQGKLLNETKLFKDIQMESSTELCDQSVNANTFFTTYIENQLEYDNRVEETGEVSAKEAARAVGIVYNWLQKQSECTQEMLLILGRLRAKAKDIALSSIFSNNSTKGQS